MFFSDLPLLGKVLFSEKVSLLPPCLMAFVKHFIPEKGCLSPVWENQPKELQNCGCHWIIPRKYLPLSAHVFDHHKSSWHLEGRGDQRSCLNILCCTVHFPTTKPCSHKGEVEKACFRAILCSFVLAFNHALQAPNSLCLDFIKIIFLGYNFVSNYKNLAGAVASVAQNRGKRWASCQDIVVSLRISQIIECFKK